MRARESGSRSRAEHCCMTANLHNLDVCAKQFAHLFTVCVERHSVACVAQCGGEREKQANRPRLLSQPSLGDWGPTKPAKAFVKTRSAVPRLEVSVS